MTSFDSLELCEPLQRALREKNYATPSPIQQLALPHVLAGRDVLGCAQTGTGKTAAFALPALEYMNKTPKDRKRGAPRVLVLAPTRELASQIKASFDAYGSHLQFRSEVIFGGVGQNPQVRALQRGTDVVVATPGRLLDLLQQRHLTLSELEIFVIDEADRMLDMGFIHDVKKIIAQLPRKRQTLFFSATMPPSIIQLANSILTNPIKVEVTPESTTVEKIDQQLFHVSSANKRDLLLHLLREQTEGLTLVFTAMKHGANRIVEGLEKSGVRAEAIHGNKSQNARERALEAFRSGKVRVLVATDIAARGIDVKGIELVINYDLPKEPECYVHRIGRTARAGAEGRAISLCDEQSGGLLKQIERTIRQEIPVNKEHPFHMAAGAGRGSIPTQSAPERRFGGGGGGGGGRGGRSSGGGGGGGFRGGRSGGSRPEAARASSGGGSSAASSSGSASSGGRYSSGGGSSSGAAASIGGGDTRKRIGFRGTSPAPKYSVR